jgi:HNH endonuclease
MPRKIKYLTDYYKVGEPNHCWLWQGCVKGNGYGYYKHLGITQMAHIAVYVPIKGEYPRNLVLDHLCRNRSCVNPNHLEVVTEQINILRGIGKAALNAKKTHCPSGHPYSGDNLKIGTKGERYCRECKRNAAIHKSLKRF